MKDLVNSGVNIVAFEKNDHKYGMTCAWMMQVDEDQLLMLLGSQSETANKIEEDDIIGISSLSLGQEEIAELFGTKHSKKVNKFAKVSYEKEDGALMICKASNMMKCEVISVGRITDNDEDYLVQVRVLSRANNNRPFMSMVDYRKYIYDKELVK